MEGALAYAFGVGMVATFNPCGFAMLPAYLSYFLGMEGARPDDDEDVTVGLMRALLVGAIMTAGFIAVFGLLGLILEPALSSVIEHLPWFTIVIGLALVVIGILLLSGRSITVNLPRIERGPGSRGLTSVFLFGVSYALVSLSCTISLFIAAISTTIEQESWLMGIGAFVAYGLGMGLVLMVLTVAIALARHSLVRNLRRIIPHVNRISGALLVLAGAYVIYFGWYELRVFDGETSGGGVARWAFELNGAVSRQINEVGPTRLGLLLATMIAATVLVTLLLRARSDDR